MYRLMVPICTGYTVHKCARSGSGDELGREDEDLDADAIGIEHEHRPVAGDVPILLGRELDVRAHPDAALVGLLDLLAAVDGEGDVLDPDVVVPVLAAVGRTEAEELVADDEVRNLLGAAVGRVADDLRDAERPEQLVVEGEGSLDVADGKVDVVDRPDRHRPGDATQPGPRLRGVDSRVCEPAARPAFPERFAESE